MLFRLRGRAVRTYLPGGVPLCNSGVMFGDRLSQSRAHTIPGSLYLLPDVYCLRQSLWSYSTTNIILYCLQDFVNLTFVYFSKNKTPHLSRFNKRPRRKKTEILG